MPSFPFRGHPNYHRRQEGLYPVQQQMEVATGGKRGPKPVNNDGVGQQEKGGNEKPSKVIGKN